MEHERVTENTIDQLSSICEVIDKEESQDDNISEDEDSNHSNVELSKTKTETDTHYNIKVIDKIDLDNNIKKSFNNIKKGVYHAGKYGNPPTVTDETKNGFIYEVRSIAEELYDDDIVTYKLKSEPNKKNPDKKYYFAIDVKSVNN